MTHVWDFLKENKKVKLNNKNKNRAIWDWGHGIKLQF